MVEIERQRVEEDLGFRPVRGLRVRLRHRPKHRIVRQVPVRVGVEVEPIVPLARAARFVEHEAVLRTRTLIQLGEAEADPAVARARGLELGISPDGWVGPLLQTAELSSHGRGAECLERRGLAQLEDGLRVWFLLLFSGNRARRSQSKRNRQENRRQGLGTNGQATSDA